MELRDFIQLFIRRRSLIAWIMGTALVIGFFGYRLQTQWYEGAVLLSVTRQAAEATPEYQYDQAYRLQADERMADTLARYLESEIGRRDTARRVPLTGVRETEFIESRISALRLSSITVQVSYAAMTPTEAERIAGAFYQAGERYVASLNEQAGNRNWFTLVASEPYAKDGRFTLPVALGVALVLGAIAAFWTVLGLWYWKGNAAKA
jgi:hypothetical protein